MLFKLHPLVLLASSVVKWQLTGGIAPPAVYLEASNLLKVT